MLTISNNIILLEFFIFDVSLALLFFVDTMLQGCHWFRVRTAFEIPFLGAFRALFCFIFVIFAFLRHYYFELDWFLIFASETFAFHFLLRHKQQILHLNLTFPLSLSASARSLLIRGLVRCL